MVLRLFLFVICSTSLGVFQGCVVGPDFEGVAPPPLTSTFSDESLSSQVDSNRLSRWWDVFGDPALIDLLAVAEMQNRDLEQAYHRVMESRAALGQSVSEKLPNGFYNSEYAYLKRSPNAQPFVGQNGDAFSRFTYGLAASWEPDLFGRLQRGIEAADADLGFQQADFDSIRLTLLADVASSYFRVRLLQQQIEIAESSLQVQVETTDLIADRTKAGVTTDLDLAQTKAFQNRTKSDITVFQRQLEVELNLLSQLLGGVPSREIESRLGFGSLPLEREMLGVGIPANLLRNRPDIVKNEKAVAAASARIGIAESDLYPQINLLGTIGLSAKTVSSLFESDSLEFSFGPSVRWNILHFGRITNNIEANKARYKQAIAGYQSSVLSAVREVEDSIAQQHGFYNEAHALEQAIAFDEESVELSLQRYKVGKANFQRVLDAQQQLLRDKQRSLEARMFAIIQTVKLYRAVGGGWSKVEVAPEFVQHNESFQHGGFSDPVDQWPQEWDPNGTQNNEFISPTPVEKQNEIAPDPVQDETAYDEFFDFSEPNRRAESNQFRRQ